MTRPYFSFKYAVDAALAEALTNACEIAPGQAQDEPALLLPGTGFGA